MKYIYLIVFLFTGALTAKPVQHQFQSDNYNHTYYLEVPENQSFPLLLMIEGSYDRRKGPRSILGLHYAISKHFLESGIGFVTMERRGVEGLHIDSTTYHLFNIPQQRFADHLELIKHLQMFPPENWNGQFIVIGASEGGPIAIKLSFEIQPSACIVLVGCGDQPLKELVWHFIQILKSSYPEYQLPALREDFEELCERVKKDPDPGKWWLGQTYLYWAEALDQTEYQQFLALDCPVMVVAGSQDLKTYSTDRLIDLAHQLNKDVTYLRIEGMGHDVFFPPWNVLEKICDFLRENNKKITNRKVLGSD